MNILLISQNSGLLPIAKRIAQEGHNSQLLVCNKKETLVGEGIVGKPKSNAQIVGEQGQCYKINLRTLLKETQPDLVVFDEVGFGNCAEFIISERMPVVGSNKWADLCELNEDYKCKLLRSCGLTKNKEEKGIEVVCGMFWDGLTSQLHHLSLTNHKFMNDDIGPDIDSAGNATMFISPYCKLIKEGVSKLEKLLKKTTYRGYIGLRCLCTDTSINPLGFSTFPIQDTLYSLLELYKGNVAQLLHSIACSYPVSGLRLPGVALGVHLSLPPFPHAFANQRVNIDGVCDANAKHLWLGEVALNGKLEYVGGHGNLGCVTARGDDVRECHRRVYRTISNLTIKDLQYRTDIGECGMSEQLHQLKRWGYV